MGRRIWIGVLFCTLSYLYLFPGSQAMLTGRTDTVLGDDTDSSAAPYHYNLILKTWDQYPKNMLYGAVYHPGANPDGGVALWYTWFERWSVVLLAEFVPLEQISVAFTFFIFVLNALLMYALSRYMQWNRNLSIAASIAWAFCCYTRARAKVHMGLAATFFLPAIFLGVLLVAKGKSWRSLAAAAGLFFLAASSSQYFIIMSAILSPLFIWFFVQQEGVKANLSKSFLRLLIAAMPAIGFLAFSRLVPIPPDAKMSVADALPKTGETKDGQVHPFLTWFAARPIDYITGDVGIGPADINPLKGMLNRYVYNNFDNSNPHERANGIRWLILGVVIWVAATLLNGRVPWDMTTKQSFMFFFVFAGVTFWLSLAPDIPSTNLGLSYFLSQLVPQFRVPSRAGVFVHFSMIVIMGTALNYLLTKPRDKKTNFQMPKVLTWLLRPGVLPVLMLLEFPPFVQSMPMAPMRPPIQSLVDSQGRCGTGMYFPYVGNSWGLAEFYHFLQQMRNSDCLLLNNVENPEFKDWMRSRFPVHEKFFEALQTNNPQIGNAFEKLVRCTPMSWLVFDQRVPEGWRQSFCQRLGWQLNTSLTCVAGDQSAAFQQLPHRCL